MFDWRSVCVISSFSSCLSSCLSWVCELAQVKFSVGPPEEKVSTLDVQTIADDLEASVFV